MKEQSYESHTRIQQLQHNVWLPLSVVLLVTTAIYSVYQFVKNGFSLQV